MRNVKVISTILMVCFLIIYAPINAPIVSATSSISNDTVAHEVNINTFKNLPSTNFIKVDTIYGEVNVPDKLVKSFSKEKIEKNI